MLKTAPNKLVATVFKTIVEDKLIPEKNKAADKQFALSNDWRERPETLYPDLDKIEYENRPPFIVSELRANKIESKIVRRCDIQLFDTEEQIFTVHRKINTTQHEHTVNMKEGYCNCYYFMCNNVPCPDIYAIIRYFPKYSFAKLPWTLLNAEHMIINGLSMANPPNYNYNDDASIPPELACDQMPTQITTFDLIPPQLTNTRLNQNYQSDLIDQISMLNQLVYAMNDTTLSQVRVMPNNPLDNLKSIYAEILQYFPKSNAGIPLFTPYRRKQPFTKRKKIQLSITSTNNVQNNNSINNNKNINNNNTNKYNIRERIPHKEPTVAQQTVKEKLSDKRERHRLRTKSAPHVPLAVFQQNEKERKKLLQQRTERVIAQKEKEYKKIPEYMIDVDMNGTISNNDDGNTDFKKRPRRMIKPSQKAIESQQYLQRERATKVSMDDVSSDSD